MSDDTFRAGWLAAAEELEKPYGKSVFTELSSAEIARAVAAMNAVVPSASDRLHASWARHWAGALKEMVGE